ncbi:MAG TPA: hypothetical protein VLB01_05105 [Thermodesulfobacteriota bacterium]|nr:hypothetical protein [Thermodesulfobacteriota bacterium]
MCTKCGRYEEEEPLWDKVIYETICEECRKEGKDEEGEKATGERE